MTDLYDVAELQTFATRLFEHAGLDAEKARVIAEILVEGDLLGHTTHGLGLLGPYLDAIASGVMTATGTPDVISETQIVETWDGKYLPGPWLVTLAADLAARRAQQHGIAAVAIRRSSHIGCLAAYLRRIAERGQMLVLACSDPSVASVAPFGGTKRIYTPNPLAAGWPSPDGPVMIDVSMSITTNGMTGRMRAEGRQFEHPWLLDAQGTPTRDPNAFFTDPPGSLQPLGGSEAGHKGYALGLLLEALTSALAGHGRADSPTIWGASVLVLALDPARFGGGEAFLRETGWMAEAVHSNPPGPGRQPVRLPGERGIRLRAEALQHGVVLHPSLPPMLATRATKAGIAVPAPL